MPQLGHGKLPRASHMMWKSLPCCVRTCWSGITTLLHWQKSDRNLQEERRAALLQRTVKNPECIFVNNPVRSRANRTLVGNIVLKIAECGVERHHVRLLVHQLGLNQGDMADSLHKMTFDCHGLLTNRFPTSLEPNRKILPITEITL